MLAGVRYCKLQRDHGSRIPPLSVRCLARCVFNAVYGVGGLEFPALSKRRLRLDGGEILLRASYLVKISYTSAPLLQLSAVRDVGEDDDGSGRCVVVRELLVELSNEPP